MSDHEFLQAMMAHKHYNDTLQFKRARREKKRKREEAAKKSAEAAKPSADLKDPEPVSKWKYKNKRKRATTTPEAPKSASTARPKKFCQHCKDNNRKYWTHNTEECYLKKPAKESNAIEALQKEFSEVKDMLKSLKKKKGSDSDSDSDE